MKKLLSYILSENPIFCLGIALILSLAMTTKFEIAYITGILVFIILFVSNLVFSLLKKLLKENMKLPIYLIIISIFVTILNYLFSIHAKYLLEMFDVYFVLIIITCAILGYGIKINEKNNCGKDILNTLGIGIGFVLSLSFIGLLREIIGSNSITVMDNLTNLTGYKAIYYNIIPNADLFPASFFLTPSGAFLVLGLLIALFNAIKGGKKRESN